MDVGVCLCMCVCGKEGGGSASWRHTHAPCGPSVRAAKLSSCNLTRFDHHSRELNPATPCQQTTESAGEATTRSTEAFVIKSRAVDPAVAGAEAEAAPLEPLGALTWVPKDISSIQCTLGDCEHALKKLLEHNARLVAQNEALASRDERSSLARAHGTCMCHSRCASLKPPGCVRRRCWRVRCE